MGNYSVSRVWNLQSGDQSLSDSLSILSVVFKVIKNKAKGKSFQGELINQSISDPLVGHSFLCIFSFFFFFFYNQHHFWTTSISKRLSHTTYTFIAVTIQHPVVANWEYAAIFFKQVIWYDAISWLVALSIDRGRFSCVKNYIIDIKDSTNPCI